MPCRLLEGNDGTLFTGQSLCDSKSDEDQEVCNPLPPWKGGAWEVRQPVADS